MMNDADYRALIEQSHMLHELTQHPGWPVFYDFLQTVVINPITTRIINGSIETHDEYKEQTGYCRGVTRALNVADEVGKRVLRERERRQEAEVATNE